MQSEDNMGLGFTAANFPTGSHVCQIYSEDSERNDVLLAFLCAGLRAGEKVACFSDRADPKELEEVLAEQNLSMEQLVETSALNLQGTSEIYFEEGRFDPERMLAILGQCHRDSEGAGFPGCRALGEMMPEVKDVKGGSRLLEYEARVNILLRERPVTIVCQYDARAFDGGTLMDILKLHASMAVHGTVVHNPYFVEPETFLEYGNASLSRSFPLWKEDKAIG